MAVQGTNDGAASPDTAGREQEHECVSSLSGVAWLQAVRRYYPVGTKANHGSELGGEQHS